MSDIVERLRGIYRIPITDGLGPAGGEEPDNPNEFVRTFPSPPIQIEAAAEIQRLRDELASAREIIGDRAIERADAREALFPEMSARIKAERQSAKAAAFEEAELVMSEICSHDKLVGQIAAFLLERDEQTTQDERDEGERETSAFYIEQMVHRAFSAAIRSRAQEGRSPVENGECGDNA